MATIKVKNSVTSGSNPSGLTFGELAVNITDRKIYIGNAVGSTITLHDQNNIVTSFNGSTGAVVGVSSINGFTGAIANVARTNEGNTFTVQQVFNAGITASTTTNVLDIIATTDGAGLRIAQTASGSSSRVGGIRLGRSSTTAANSYIENYVGQLKFFNGISGTNNTPGLNMLQLSTTNAQFGVPIDGATFSSTTGEVKIQKSAYLGFGDSAYLRIVGSDNIAVNIYNSDIRANADAVTNTIHTLPATTGTLLNTASSYVTGVNGITGPVGITAGSNITITLSGKTLTIASTASGGSSTGFTYASSAPSTPTVGDRWIDSDTGKEYVYVNDGSSSQWIEPVSSNGLVGITYTSSTNTITFGVTGEFTGPVTSDGGFRISSGAINAQTGTTYSLLSTDNGKIITMNNGSSSIVTIPSGLPVGYNTTVIQLGVGQVGFTGSGTTINSAEGKLNIANRYSAANIISYTTNTFILAGGLTG